MAGLQAIPSQQVSSKIHAKEAVSLFFVITTMAIQYYSRIKTCNSKHVLVYMFTVLLFQ